MFDRLIRMTRKPTHHKISSTRSIHHCWCIECETEENERDSDNRIMVVEPHELIERTVHRDEPNPAAGAVAQVGGTDEEMSPFRCSVVCECGSGEGEGLDLACDMQK